MHRLLYRQGLTLAAAQAEIEALQGSVPDGDDDVALLLAFLAGAERGIVR
jgi:UDP-N-acetylglucosamine acyltransferase